MYIYNIAEIINKWFWVSQQVHYKSGRRIVWGIPEGLPMQILSELSAMVKHMLQEHLNIYVTVL